MLRSGRGLWLLSKAWDFLCPSIVIQLPHGYGSQQRWLPHGKSSSDQKGPQGRNQHTIKGGLQTVLLRAGYEGHRSVTAGSPTLRPSRHGVPCLLGCHWVSWESLVARVLPGILLRHPILTFYFPEAMSSTYALDSTTVCQVLANQLSDGPSHAISQGFQAPSCPWAVSLPKRGLRLFVGMCRALEQ